MPATPPLRIDIVSDVVCPWCIVGYAQLRQALDATGTEAEIVWQPFELNPQMGPEGQDLREHIAEKYGSTTEESDKVRAHLTTVGDDLGFAFDFTDGMRMVNTFAAHQLLHWAEPLGLQMELKLALFKAYFTDHLDISDPAALIDMAAQVGLDRDAAADVLESGTLVEKVRAEERFWTDQGINSAPSMIFDRKHLVAGAQGVENYTSILTQLAQMRAA